MPPPARCCGPVFWSCGWASNTRRRERAGAGTGTREGLSEMMSFEEQVRTNQVNLAANVAVGYDFIVCGAGSSGCVVARRLAENPAVRVLLLEAGGEDDLPSVTDPELRADNLHGERDWGFWAEPNPELNGRSLSMSMGKVLGGGSSINAQLWARGHKTDWDLFASEADDPGWNYDSVSAIYRRIEDWHGVPDPEHRGIGGLVHVEPASGPASQPSVLLTAVDSIGISSPTPTAPWWRPKKAPRRWT